MILEIVVISCTAFIVYKSSSIVVYVKMLIDDVRFLKHENIEHEYTMEKRKLETYQHGLLFMRFRKDIEKLKHSEERLLGRIENIEAENLSKDIVKEKKKVKKV